MKMKKLFYMLPLLAIFASCGFGGVRNSAESSQTSDYTSDVTSADESAYTETSESQSEISNDQPYIFNDLTAGLAIGTRYQDIECDLKGNIKKLEIVKGSSRDVMEFDKDGFLKRDGYNEYSNEYSNYVFDAKGRLKSRVLNFSDGEANQEFEYYENYVIEKEIHEYPEGRDTSIYKYEFNKSGKLTSAQVLQSGYIEGEVGLIQRGDGNKVTSATYDDHEGGRYSFWYFYDDNAKLVRSVTKSEIGQDMIEIDESTSYYQTDSHGNWIKKSPSENFDVDVVERHIEYY